MRRWARTRGRNCSPSRAHPRRLLSGRRRWTSCSLSRSSSGRRRSASSQARRRKRKKWRKKRLPKSSARHPLPSGIRTRKSGHYSTSHSFWQCLVLCPGVAWFNSGYSPCVSSQRLLVFFLIFYVLDSDPEVVPESGHSSTHPWYLAATGSVFALPGRYRKIGVSARRLQSFFPTSPLYLAVTLLCLVLHLEYRTMDFPGDDSRNGFRTQHSSV